MSTHGSREEERCTQKVVIGECGAVAYARCRYCRNWRCYEHLEVQKDEGILRCQKQNCGEREKQSA